MFVKVYSRVHWLVVVVDGAARNSEHGTTIAMVAASSLSAEVTADGVEVVLKAPERPHVTEALKDTDWTLTHRSTDTPLVSDLFHARPSSTLHARSIDDDSSSAMLSDVVQRAKTRDASNASTSDAAMVVLRLRLATAVNIVLPLLELRQVKLLDAATAHTLLSGGTSTKEFCEFCRSSSLSSMAPMRVFTCVSAAYQTKIQMKIKKVKKSKSQK